MRYYPKSHGPSNYNHIFTYRQYAVSVQQTTVVTQKKAVHLPSYCAQFSVSRYAPNGPRQRIWGVMGYEALLSSSALSWQRSVLRWTSWTLPLSSCQWYDALPVKPTKKTPRITRNAFIQIRWNNQQSVSFWSNRHRLGYSENNHRLAYSENRHRWVYSENRHRWVYSLIMKL